jgi:uncharacterized repeat protein (TIGR02543 family)
MYRINRKTKLYQDMYSMWIEAPEIAKTVQPGLYIITVYCSEESKKGFFLKDVAEKLHGVALDAGIPDCTSTALALVIEKVNNCYNDWYHCYNKLTKIYKLVETIAKDVGKVDIAAIMSHNSFGDYCDDVYDDLVDLVCDFGCCASPGTTGGGGGGGPTPGPGPGPEPDCYTLEITIEGNGEVEFNEAPKTTLPCYPPNTELSLIPKPDSGWQFTGWTGPNGNDVSGSDPYAITMNGHKEITANFKPIPPTKYKLTMAVSPDGGGTTVPTIGGSPYEHVEGEVINISASPEASYQFLNWTTSAGGTFGSTNNTTTTFTMPGNDVTVTANFEQICPTEIRDSFRVAFEDIPWKYKSSGKGCGGINDYDYNDCVADVDVFGTFIGGKLKGIQFEVTYEWDGAGGVSHQFGLKMPEVVGKPYTAKLDEVPTYANSSGGFVIFKKGDSKKTYVLTITFDTPFAYTYVGFTSTDIHGNNLSVKPFVILNGSHEGQSINETLTAEDAGNEGKRVLIVPKTWTIPGEGVHIWDVYKYVSRYDCRPKFDNPGNWTKK